MNKKLYVGNLSYTTTEGDLMDLFNQVGQVVSVVLIKDRDTGKSKGFAFIEMSSQEDAEKAINKYNGYTMDERELRVSIARPKEERPRTGFTEDRRTNRQPRNRNTRRY